MKTLKTKIKISHSTKVMALEALLKRGEIDKFVKKTLLMQYISEKIRKLRLLALHVQKVRKLRTSERLRQISQEKRSIVISVSVWGYRYLKIFRKVFLPSFLNSQVRGHLSKKYQLILIIHCFAIEKPIIEDIVDNFETDNITPYVVEMPNKLLGLASDIKYEIYGINHMMDLEFAKSLTALFVPIAPDGLHSADSLSNYIELCDNKRKAIFISALRAQAEFVLPKIKEITNQPNIIISASEVVKLGLENIHHDFNRYFKYKGNNKAPDYLPLLITPLNNGVMIKSKHLHPIVVDTKKIGDVSICTKTVDASLCFILLGSFKDNTDSIYVVQDSNEGIMIDLTYRYPNLFEDVFVDRSFDDDYISQQSKLFDSPEEEWNYSRPIHYHSTEAISHGFYRNSPSGLIFIKMSH